MIHSAIDIQKFHFKPRANLNKPLKIIHPGRIEPRKGQLDAVRLLAELNQAGIDARLLIVGEKWIDKYTNEVEHLISDLHLAEKIQVHPMVSQEELVSFYHQSDICFFPSYQEIGFSRTPIEAMACGCIVISYGNEGSDEIIENEKNGFLVTPGNYPEITGIISELMEKSEKFTVLVNAARQQVVEICSMSNYVDRIENIFTAIVEK